MDILPQNNVSSPAGNSLPQITSTVKRVLFMNRSTAYSMPGGDTMVMNRLQEQLRSRGIVVDFSADPTVDVSSYDIVHLFNLTLQQLTDAFAKNAATQKAPVVVTSLQEDFPLYSSKAETAVKIFAKYLEIGQSRDFFEQSIGLLKKVPPSPVYTAPWTVVNADRIFPCGVTEERFIKTLYPQVRSSPVPFGSTIKNIDASPDLFCSRYGVKDFVLFVARVEMRKNQLMLLRALEDDDIPLVFADGGFTYTPAYRALCDRYKRKGKTIFTGRLDDETLISAFKAARVHCLPSWYELPGLVTIEAARYGCTVVASSWGGIPDYLGDTCYYCEPDSHESIRAAIMKAFEFGRPSGLLERAMSYTWEKSADITLIKYAEVIAGRKQTGALPVAALEVPDIYTLVEEVTKMVEKNRNREACAYYQKYRSLFPALPQLAKFDELMTTVAGKLS
jgi:glycosyltransferase involved in cell wall biosynthesis